MAMIIKYKGDELLSNQFENLKWRVGGLSAIAQNPEMEITEKDFLEWDKRANEVEIELLRLIKLATRLVRKGEVIVDGEN